MSVNDTEEQGATAYNPTNVFSTLMAKAEVKTFIFMTFNLVSSPALIFVNKSIFHYYHFNFATALTCFHFACTGIGLFICAKVGLFEPKAISMSELVPLIFCNAVCTPLANLSMQLNSLGFYQVMKIAITPCVVAMEFFVYGKTLDRRLALCLVPVCIGVAICTVTDMEVRFVGAIVGSLMTLSTVFVQVVFKNFQEKHKVDSMQLLYYVMPLSAVAQFGTIPLAEDVPTLKSFEWTNTFTMWVMLSGFLAFCVNLSGFLVIGKATPVTYNVVTHCKTVVVIVGGFVLFGSPLAAKNVMGIIVTLLGAWGYAYFKLMGPAETQQSKRNDKADDIEAAEPLKK
jgi:solute carrier family 35 protein E3